MPIAELSNAHPLTSECDASPSNKVKSATVWFDDGNVILHVENTLFRVHGGLLSANSEIFSDMFNIPQPNSDASVDGCPVIRLHDALEDWEAMLLAFCYPMRMHPFDESLSPASLISMLRLGKKYQFERVFEQALARLRKEFPQTLDAYDRIFDSEHPAGRTKCASSGDTICPHMACSPWNLFDLTNIMVELGIQSTLPIAYYLCAIQPGEIICNGCLRPDNTVSMLRDDAKNVVFSRQDRLKSVRHNFVWLYGFELDAPTVPYCDDNGRCAGIAASLVCQIEMDASKGIHHPLSAFDSHRFRAFCIKCQKAQMWYQQERWSFWDWLPRIFMLSKWTDLKD